MTDFSSGGKFIFPDTYFVIQKAGETACTPSTIMESKWSICLFHSKFGEIYANQASYHFGCISNHWL